MINLGLSINATTLSGPDRIMAEITTLSISEQSLPVYDSDAHGAGTAAITLSGTHDADGALLEYRIARVSDDTTVVNWTSFIASSGGVWSAMATVPPSFDALRAEVRAVGAPTITAVQAGEFFAGYIVGYMGQSLARRPILEDFTASFTPPDKTMWCLFNDLSGGFLSEGIQEVTSASTLGLRRMAAVAGQHSDAPILLVDMTDSGTARQWAADADNAGRDWATTIADPVAYIRNRGSDLSILSEAWFTGDAGTHSDFERHFAPFYLRRQIGGLADVDDLTGVQDYVTGTTVSAVPLRPYDADHHLWDLSSAGDAGLFDATRTKWVPLFGTSYINRDAPVLDGEIPTNDTQKANLRGALETIATTSVGYEPITLSSVVGWTGQEAFGGHLAQPLGTHVQDNDPDGESLAAVSYMQGILRGLGQLGPIEPRVTGAVWASNGAYVDVTIALPHGGILSTPFAQHEAGAYDGDFEGTNWTAPATTPATLRELHEVQGFSITQSGSRKFGDFTALIHDAASGVVRITPATPFVDGDSFAFGYGDGIHLLNETDIAAARPHTRMPIETSVHVSGAGYGYPVVREPAKAALFTASGIAAGPSFASKGAANTGHYTAPVMPAAQSAWTLRLDAQIADGSNGNFLLAEMSGLNMRVLLDVRAGWRGLRFNLKSADGTNLFAAAGNGGGGDFPSGRGVSTITFTQDRGDGLAEVKSFWNGIAQQALTAPAGPNPTFATNRPLEILNTIGADCRLYRLDVYHDYAPLGDVSGLTAVHSVSGDAAAWNAPGTGLTKVGDAFA